MSSARSSGESSMPSRSWIQWFGAAISPPERAVEPPRTPSFSRKMTFLSRRAAVMAAANPAPPDPTTITSASVGRSSGTAGVAWPFFLKSLALAPDASMASLTACMNAMLVSEAPETASTSSVWFSTMRFESVSMATSPMPSVSLDESTVMRSIAPSFITTSMSKFPCFPMPLPT